MNDICNTYECARVLTWGMSHVHVCACMS